METSRAYFTRRAQQERASAADAASAQARKAHLELAFRLVRVAIEPPLLTWPEGAVPQAAGGSVENALVAAFPLTASDSFESLLKSVDAADV